MIEFLARLFDTDFMPHVMCLRTPSLIWLHSVSDGCIAIAYFLIPFGLLRLVQKRRDLAFHWMFVLFAAFILSCGATHVLAIVTLWIPIYRFEAVVKIFTAAVSLAAAYLLIRLIPQIATLPSPVQWRLSNEELKAEISQRKTAEAAMLSLNADLERRVEERTRELEERNVMLQELKASWDLAHGFIRDMNDRITFWCEGSEHLYGFTKQEATGRTPNQLLKTKFTKPLSEINAELRRKGSWTGELLHTTKSGACLQVATHWVLQRDSAGCEASVIEVNNDITDRFRADEASRRLADLVESSDDAIIGTTADGTVTSWNGSAEALFGYSAAEMHGESIERLTPPARTSDELAIVASVGQGGRPSRYETERIARNGRRFTVSLAVSPIRDEAGKVIGTSQILRDISEAKARDEAFRLSEERQRLAVEAGQVGLWYLDVHSLKHIWTQRCKELHGLGIERPVPDYPASLELIHSDDREAFAAALARTMEGTVDLAMEYRTRGLDFRTKWIQTQARPQRDSKGKVTAIHGTVIDLTARREMEDKLRRVNTELEQFAYAAAHDLQEPLRNVALTAALLKTDHRGDGSEGNDPEPRLLTILIDNARRMETMVKDLLAYSQALETSSAVEAASADANLVLSQALQNLSASINDNHAEISSDSLPLVSMHETHLRQVLQNLIGNALKYAGHKTPQIHIGARSRREDVLLFVRDNGVGISSQFHDRIFRMFKRLHDGQIKGNGIGLAVCKRIVEYYGGHIWIESQIGDGATFFFTIPSTATTDEIDRHSTTEHSDR